MRRVLRFVDSRLALDKQFRPTNSMYLYFDNFALARTPTVPPSPLVLTRVRIINIWYVVYCIYSFVLVVDFRVRGWVPPPAGWRGWRAGGLAGWRAGWVAG